MPTCPWWTHCSGRKNRTPNTNTVYLVGITWGAKDIRGLNTFWAFESTLAWRGQSCHEKMPVSVHKVVIKPEIALSSVQFSSVTQSCLTLCGPMNHSMPGLPVHHQLPESTQTYVHWVGDAIQPSHPLSSPSPPALSPSQHQGLFQWVNSSHHMAKVLAFQLQHQSFQWTPRTDLL